MYFSGSRKPYGKETRRYLGLKKIQRIEWIKSFPFRRCYDKIEKAALLRRRIFCAAMPEANEKEEDL